MMSDNKRLRKPERQFYTPKQRNPDMEECNRQNDTGNNKVQRGVSEPKEVGSYGRHYNYNDRGGGGGNGGGGGGGYHQKDDKPHFMKFRQKYGQNQSNMPYNNDSSKPNDMPYNRSVGGGEQKAPETLRLPPNIEQLAPRFKRKYLRESGLPSSYLDNMEKTVSMDDLGKNDNNNHQYGQYKKPGGPPKGGPKQHHNNRNNHHNNNKGMKDSYNNTNTYDMRRPRSRSSDVNCDDRRDIDEISQSSGYFQNVPRHIYNSNTNVYSSNNSLFSNDSNWQNEGYRNSNDGGGGGHWEKSKKHRENRNNTNHHKLSVNNRLRMYSNNNSSNNNNNNNFDNSGATMTNLQKQLENATIAEQNKPYDLNAISDWNQEVENDRMMKSNENIFNSQENIHYHHKNNGQMTLPFDYRNRRGKYNNHNRRRSFTTDNFQEKDYYNSNNHVDQIRDVASPKPWNNNNQNYHQNDGHHPVYDRPPIHHQRNRPNASSRESSIDRYEYRPNSRNGDRRRNNNPNGKYFRNYNNPNPLEMNAADKINSNETSWRNERNVNVATHEDEIKTAREIKEQVNALTQKILFDPTNPNRPIIVNNSHPNRSNTAQDTNCDEPDVILATKSSPQVYNNNVYQLASLDYIIVNPPIWYDQSTREYQMVHKKILVDELKKYDFHIQTVIGKRTLFKDWDEYIGYRVEVQNLLKQFLISELKFCQQENVETHFWKLLYHSIIDWMRKWLSDETDVANKNLYKTKLFELIENGAMFFESLLGMLEEHYNFSLNEFMGQNTNSIKSLKNVGLALVSAQKILIFLGDLARYKEQINNSNNYGRAKQWYVKAQQILPKNGRPYNSLAILSICTKRKPDAVYFYMRSIMSSNSFQSARESLVGLFDEIRKKYESTQKKREESQVRLTKPKKQPVSGALRKETWIHPESGQRIYLTSSLDPEAYNTNDNKSLNFENELKGLDPIELNKRFILSFLHVQGKLMTKVGMESFVTCAKQMLGEFRALLSHTPIAITSSRFLQLIALNMFSIDCNLPKSSGEKSEAHEQALSVALSMFGIILERFNEVIVKALQQQRYDEHVTKIKLILPEDATVMLPAIKIWCDWMRYHENIWNPPFDNVDLKSGYLLKMSDPWDHLAIVAGHLETIDIDCSKLALERCPESELLQLPENVTLAGFTPLAFYETEEHLFYHHADDVDVIQNTLRLYKLYEFCTKFLCFCNPPVLNKVCGDAKPIHYISVIQNYKTNTTDDLHNENSIIQGDYIDSFNSDELNNLGAENQNNFINNNDNNNMLGDSCENDSETRILLQKKDELERQHKLQEMGKERLQKILRESTIGLHIEVRPKFLIPDTNCFVDCLSSIEKIALAYPTYQLMVPLVVVNELEGLSRGGRNLSKAKSFAQPGQPIDLLSHSSPTHKSSNEDSEIQHAIKVASISKEALIFLKSKNTTIKCVTSRGSILSTATFTVEDDSIEPMSNDDKILATALNLCKTENDKLSDTGEVRQVFRKVVLLTTDRNLRVKALSRDVPVREMADFIKWAGLEKSCS